MDDEQVLSSNFEAGVEAILHGDVATLERLLRENPELIRIRSPRKHGATLLQYLAANGVERQRHREMLLRSRWFCSTQTEADSHGKTPESSHYMNEVSALL